MLWLKGCPRCHGDLHRVADFSGYDEAVCIQCGYVASSAVTATLPGWTDRAPRRRAASAPARAA